MARMRYEPKLCEGCGYDIGLLDCVGNIGVEVDWETDEVTAVIIQGRWFYPKIQESLEIPSKEC